jgi:hypothetical protein
MPGKGASRTALIHAKIVALAPIPKANVITTVALKAGRFKSARMLYRRSRQKASIMARDQNTL